MTIYTDLFDSIVADVTTLTNRPDLSAEIALAVRTATLTVHMAEAFPRDSVAQAVTLPVAAYNAVLDSLVLFPRIRGLSTVRILGSDGTPLDFPEIEIIEMGDIRDPIYHELKTDVAYMAGTAVNIRCSLEMPGVLLEYFQLPFVNRTQYNSWIAQIIPDVIVYLAASILFSTNGNEEKAKSYQSMYEKVLLPQLKSSFLTSALR